MSVSISNRCHEFLSQAIKRHRVLVAWLLGTRVNKICCFVFFVFFGVDFYALTVPLNENDFNFNQWSQWSSECFKADWGWRKKHKASTAISATWRHILSVFLAALHPLACNVCHAPGRITWCILCFQTTTFSVQMRGANLKLTHITEVVLFFSFMHLFPFLISFFPPVVRYTCTIEKMCWE